MDGDTPPQPEADATAAVARPPRWPRAARRAAAFVASLVLGLLVHFTIDRAVRRGEVLRGVWALGRSLGSLSGDALADAVRKLEPTLRERALRVRVRGREFPVRVGELGCQLDVSATASRALSAGREGTYVRQFAWWLSRPFAREVLTVACRVEGARRAAAFESMERAALGEPGAEGGVAYRDGIVATYPRDGWVIDPAGATWIVERAASGASGEPVELPVARKTPVLARAAVDSARAEAERLLAGPVVLTAASGDKVLTFTVADLGHALETRIISGSRARLDVGLGREALRATLDRHRPALEVPPRDAGFEVSPRHEIRVTPSELGTRLDDDAVLMLVPTLAAGPLRKGELPFRTDVTPALTTEQAAALGVRELVAKYTTYFPCCEARVKNIARMAALVDGKIVRPGEQFSLNAVSGPRTTASGFVGGPTIVEGEMEMTVGGGVSQFATTLFNAAFDGGYEIVQRQAHTYWFPRYPEGHDATLGFPLPDLIFRNDTRAGVLVKAQVGPRQVTVSLYGDNEGRKVERHASTRFDVVQPETEYEPNPERSPDDEKVLFGGMIGWSLHVTRTVTFADGTKKEERRKVVYNPRARRVETHPCRIPEDAPGHTDEKCPEPEPVDGGAAGE